MRPSTRPLDVTFYHCQTKSGVFYHFPVPAGASHSDAWHKAMTMHLEG